MGYVVVTNGTNSGRYYITNTCNKPRIAIKNGTSTSYLPLKTTTSTYSTRATVNITNDKSYVFSTSSSSLGSTVNTYMTSAKAWSYYTSKITTGSNQTYFLQTSFRNYPYGNATLRTDTSAISRYANDKYYFSYTTTLHIHGNYIYAFVLTGTSYYSYGLNESLALITNAGNRTSLISGSTTYKTRSNSFTNFNLTSGTGVYIPSVVQFISTNIAAGTTSTFGYSGQYNRDYYTYTSTYHLYFNGTPGDFRTIIGNSQYSAGSQQHIESVASITGLLQDYVASTKYSTTTSTTPLTLSCDTWQ